MNALDFLAVGAASDGAVAVSALARAQRDVGATFEERDGWQVPVSIPGEQEQVAAVGVADLSHLTKLELRPAGNPLDGGEAAVWYRLSPRRALMLCSAGAAATVRAQVGDRFVLDVTGAYSIIALSGPEAGTLLRRLTHLHHFPSGGEIAHVQGHVLERPIGGNVGYWILCAQEYGEYVWEVAVDRASALGGGPVGVDAIGADVL